MKFTKLSSIKYNKNDKSYQVVYDFQKVTEDFTSTGKVNYENFPIQYSFSLIPDKNKPFLIKDIIEIHALSTGWPLSKPGGCFG